MSSFKCSTCGADNLDSATGYIQGCRHHPPEKEGYYLVACAPFSGDCYDVAEWCGRWKSGVPVMFWRTLPEFDLQGYMTDG